MGAETRLGPHYVLLVRVAARRQQPLDAALVPKLRRQEERCVVDLSGREGGGGAL